LSLENLVVLKVPYYAPFHKMYNKSLMSPECVCEFSAKNIQTDNFLQHI